MILIGLAIMTKNWIKDDSYLNICTSMYNEKLDIIYSPPNLLYTENIFSKISSQNFTINSYKSTDKESWDKYLMDKKSDKLLGNFAY